MADKLNRMSAGDLLDLCKEKGLDVPNPDRKSLLKALRFKKK